jgi:hypothetical protein
MKKMPENLTRPILIGVGAGAIGAAQGLDVKKTLVLTTIGYIVWKLMLTQEG